MEAGPPDREVICPSYEVGGVRIDALTMSQAVAAVLHRPGPRAVHLCNAYTVSLALRDPVFTEQLNRGELNLPDGMPLVWIARGLGLRHLDARVDGPSLMAACLDHGRSRGTRHYFYGSRRSNDLARFVTLSTV